MEMELKDVLTWVLKGCSGEKYVVKKISLVTHNRCHGNLYLSHSKTDLCASCISSNIILQGL